MTKKKQLQIGLKYLYCRGNVIPTEGFSKPACHLILSSNQASALVDSKALEIGFYLLGHKRIQRQP